VDAPHRFVIEFAERPAGRTTMTVISTFASIDAMQQLLEMGMEEGMREAMGQIDGVLTEAA
jgi:uncharacterized protein YndB with AHSA1/START domain